MQTILIKRRSCIENPWRNYVGTLENNVYKYQSAGCRLIDYPPPIGLVGGQRLVYDVRGVGVIQHKVRATKVMKWTVGILGIQAGGQTLGCKGTCCMLERGR